MIFALIILAILIGLVLLGFAPLSLIVGVIIFGLVLIFIGKLILEGLAGAAGMVDGLTCCGCGSLFLGIIMLVIISSGGGFLAGFFSR